MKVKDILELLAQGKKPLVRLTSNLWDDGWGEKGMIARIVGSVAHQDKTVELKFDFNEHKAHNLALQSHGYYINAAEHAGRKTGTAFEVGLMKENDIQESVYFELEDEIFVELADSPILALYAKSGSKLPYVEWLEVKLEELVPDCMKDWKVKQ